MLGDRLRSTREQQNLSREYLGRLSDISGQQIYRYEKGEQMPLADVVARIAQALNISSDYLLGLTDDPSPHTIGNKLSISEQTLLAAWRRGDKLEAIRVIVSTEGKNIGSI